VSIEEARTPPIPILQPDLSAALKARLAEQDGLDEVISEDVLEDFLEEEAPSFSSKARPGSAPATRKLLRGQEDEENATPVESQVSSRIPHANACHVMPGKLRFPNDIAARMPGSLRRAGEKNAAVARQQGEEALMQERRHKTQQIAKRLRAFDKRWVAGLRNYRPEGDEDDRQLKFGDGREDVQLPQTNQPFTVVGCSSQLSPCLAKNLQEARGGRWDTLPGRVKNEFVVFELGQTVAITSVELNLPGTSATPKRCRMQYAEASPDGPWVDAWKFTIEATQPGIYRSTHQYGKAVTIFKDFVIDICRDLEGAWQFLTINSDGKLTLQELGGLLLKLRKQDEGMFGGEVPDEVAVFKELDRENLGFVHVYDLLADTPPSAPIAPWWRLLVTENRGSPTCVSLLAPLSLYALAKEESVDDGGFTKGVEMLNFIDQHLFFAPQNLNLSDKDKMIRRLSREYGFPQNEVEDIYDVFKVFDTSGDLELDREEFIELLCQLHDVKDRSDVPASRLDFFWRQVDQDGGGCVSFEEFLIWYRLYYEKMGKAAGGMGSSISMEGRSRKMRPLLKMESHSPSLKAPIEQAEEKLKRSAERKSSTIAEPPEEETSQEVVARVPRSASNQRWEKVRRSSRKISTIISPRSKGSKELRQSSRSPSGQKKKQGASNLQRQTSGMQRQTSGMQRQTSGSMKR